MFEIITCHYDAISKICEKNLRKFNQYLTITSFGCKKNR